MKQATGAAGQIDERMSVSRQLQPHQMAASRERGPGVDGPSELSREAGSQ